jgi:hypothetical protein
MGRVVVGGEGVLGVSVLMPSLLERTTKVRVAPLRRVAN